MTDLSVGAGGEGQGAVTDVGGVTRIGTGGTEVTREGTTTSDFVDPATLQTAEQWQEAFKAGKLPPLPQDSTTGTTGTDTLAPAAAPDSIEGTAAKPALTASDDPRFAPFTKEYGETGTLSDDSVKAAAAAFNVPEDMVRSYVAGLGAQANAGIAPFHEAFGGAEGYAGFAAWADSSMTPEAKAAYNKALDGNPDVALQMALAYKGQYEASGAAPPPRDITGGTGGAPDATSGDAYASWPEVTADMGKPEYQRDPAFRAKVEAKLARSKF